MTAEQLRNSILQMAVTGKLVPQNPNDEPAHVLLERIRKEKEQLITKGLIKKEKKTSYIYRGADNMLYEKIGENKPVNITDEVPFDIPDSWEWVNLSTITNELTLNDGNWVLSSDMSANGEVKLIQLGSIGNGKYIDKGFKQVSEKRFYELNGKRIYSGYLLVNRLIGDKMLCCIVPPMDDFLMTAVDVCWIAPQPDKYNLEYLMFVLLSGFFQGAVKLLGRGTTRFRISKGNLVSIYFPFPPLAEQTRIVSEIKKYQPLITEYEKKQTILGELIDGFPKQLKQSILQMAVTGKLVPQDYSEENAAKLLARARTNNNVDGQRVKQKIITEISDEEKAFDIPDSWEWIKLGSVCTIARGGSPRPIKEYITDSSDGVNWIKIGDTDKNGKYISSTAEKIKPSGVSKSRMVHAGDFLLTNSMSFGRPYILKTDGCIHDGWLVISQSTEVFDQDYLYWMLSSGYAYSQFCGKVSGAVVKNLNSDKVANSVFPLPPLQEQKRIVAKLEELLPLCETLMI